ncbi:uncharacterized protein [Gossypium hirsutum]|uniref:Uncharacterized protein n=1 Tax=Gossypium hirsutum TaxID=3635 RepID=A0ABM2ZLG9_GOSHI|nr:uncharacterized protein LOC121213994 [Gossypium hirsutum]
MATEAASGNKFKNHQSFNNEVPADGSSGPSITSLRKIQQFSKHDTVKLVERNFLLWKQQILLILEGYGLHEFVLGTVSILPQSVTDTEEAMKGFLEAEVEEGSLVTLNPNVSYVDELGVLSRSAIIVLMRILRVIFFELFKFNYVVSRFRSNQSCY